MARMRPIEHEDELSLVEHLGELRTRIIISLAAFGVALGLCFWQNHLILRLMNAPLGGRRPSRCANRAFTTTFRVAAYAAIVIALPVVLYELYAFIVPALRPQERRVALPILLLVPVLFVCGVAFGYLSCCPRR